jgi:hypothetical protein
LKIFSLPTFALKSPNNTTRNHFYTFIIFVMLNWVILVKKSHPVSILSYFQTRMTVFLLFSQHFLCFVHMFYTYLLTFRNFKFFHTLQWCVSVYRIIRILKINK